MAKRKEEKRRERNKGARLEKAWLHRSETDTLYVGKKKLHKGSEIVGGKQQQANGLETTNSRSLS